MEEPAYRTCRIFKALGNPLRYRILARLADGPATPTQLSKQFRRPLDAISRNLTHLHDLDLVWFHPAPPNLIYKAKYDIVRRLLDAGANCSAVARHEDPGGPRTTTATESSGTSPLPSDCGASPAPPSGAPPPG